MENDINHIDELIGKYLAGEASGDEAQQVEAWSRQGEENRKYLDHLRTIFDRAASIKEWHEFDADAAFIKLKSKLKKPEAKTVVLPRSSSDLQLYWRIAAGIIIVLGIGFFTYQWISQPTEMVALKAEKQIVHDTLPDGSITVLNKQSEIAYEYNARKKTRELKLTGEAYFSVKHEVEKPFVIETQEVIIEDIGTTFNVKSYPESRTIEVFVETGEVKFYSLQNPGLNLKAGETGIYDKASKSFARLSEADTNILAYKTRVFNFNNTDLGSMVETLNEVYEVKIKLGNESLKNCRLNVKFKSEPIEAIAEIIAETLNLNVTKANGEIILDGTSCGE